MKAIFTFLKSLLSFSRTAVRKNLNYGSPFPQRFPSLFPLSRFLGRGCPEGGRGLPREKASKKIRSIVKLFLPSACLFCLKTSKTHLCNACYQELPWLKNACISCGNTLPTTDSSVTHCGACVTHPPSFNRLFALFRYERPVMHIIRRFKFNNHLVVGYVFGELMAEQLREKEKPELLIPVPLHPRRLRERGYNQALELARQLGKDLQIRIDFTSCARQKETAPQHELKGDQRKQNMKNAFTIKKPITAKHVAIIDDVITTGHTAEALAKALRKSGVEKIDVWCCAKTQKEG